MSMVNGCVCHWGHKITCTVEREQQQRRVCGEEGQVWCWMRSTAVGWRGLSGAVFLKVETSGVHLGEKDEKSTTDFWWGSA